MSTILKILLARRFCLIVIGLLTMMTISAQSVPDITLTQALKLDHHGNPFKVLEKSNVEIVREMVELIENHRLYEANSKAVTTQDTMLDNSVNQIGRLS